MKRFLLAMAAVAALTVGSSFTNSAMAHGPGYGHHGHHHGGNCGPSYGGGYRGGYGGGYGGYSAYRPVVVVPSYGYGNPGYGGGYGGYGYGNHGVIQIYGARGGFTFGY